MADLAALPGGYSPPAFSELNYLLELRTFQFFRLGGLEGGKRMSGMTMPTKIAF